MGWAAITCIVIGLVSAGSSLWYGGYMQAFAVNWAIRGDSEPADDCARESRLAVWHAGFAVCVGLVLAFLVERST